MDKQQYNEREGFRHRGEIINELNFIYKRLLRLIPALFRRAPEPRLADVLNAQHARDIGSNAGLVKVAMDIGQPPGPCVCEEAEALVEDVYHGDRAGATPQARTWGIVRGLKAVRVFLIQAWGRLIAELDHGSDERSSAQQEAAALQHQEAAQHRELVELTNELEEGKDDSHDNGHRRNSA